MAFLKLFGHGPGGNVFTNDQLTKAGKIVICGSFMLITLGADNVRLKINNRQLRKQNIFGSTLTVEEAKVIIAAYKAGLPLPTFEGEER